MNENLSDLRNQCLKLARRFSEIYCQLNLSCAAAESLTGGLISELIVAVPGSSAWFDCGLVTYSNEAKMQFLGVEESVIKQHGAVSAECANQMVCGALRSSRADVAVAVTGVAGPDGGTERNPVGSVWLGIARRGQLAVTGHFQFSGDRESVRYQTALRALEALAAAMRAEHEAYMQGVAQKVQSAPANC